MGLAAIGHHKLLGSVSAGDIYWASAKVGQRVRRMEDKLSKLFNGTDNEPTESDENVSTKLPILN